MKRSKPRAWKGKAWAFWINKIGGNPDGWEQREWGLPTVVLTRDKAVKPTDTYGKHWGRWVRVSVTIKPVAARRGK